MSNYTMSANVGEKIPTIRMTLKEGIYVMAEIILLPHSLELYELHLSEVSKDVKGKTVDIGKAVLKYIFNDLKKIQKLMVTVPTHNRLANALAKKLMVHEGTLTKSFWFNGVMEDQEIYGISRGEVECL